MTEACEELRTALQDRNEAQIVALADCLHNVPLMLAANRGAVSHSFRRRELRAYRARWRQSFLADYD